ncbi:MAG: EamA family transporter [Actinomycetota bacterium]|nr:EamA family transporter [Actinomycetota bacterium]
MSRGAVGVALASVGAVIFGVTATLVGFVIEDIDPFQLASLRVAVGGLFLLPWAIVHRAAILRAPVLVAIVGVLQIALNAGLYIAIDRIGVGPAVGLEFLAPVLVVTWDRVAGHAHPRPLTWAAVASAVIGVALLVQIGDLDSLDMVGVLAGLASAVGLAVYLRLGEHAGKIVGGFPLAAGAITIGGAVGFIVARPWSMSIPSDPAVIWMVVVLGTLGLAIPLSMEIAALSRVPARIIGVIITIEPVAAAVTAWIFLDQALGASQIVGLILIVIAVGAVSLTTSSSRPDPVVIAEAP